jgi:putative sigma-54 modulation protein
MNITIQSIRFDADIKLVNFIQEKLQKLPQFFDRIVDVQVYLRLDKNNENGNKVVEFKVNVPNTTLLATHQASTFEEAVDLVLDNMKRQLTKYKERLRVG